MFSKRFLFGPLYRVIFLVAALGAHASGRQLPVDLRAGAQVNKESALSFTLEQGALRIKTTRGSVLSGMKLLIRFGDGSSLTGALVLTGQERGSDKVGTYERLSYRLTPPASAAQTSSQKSADVVLHLQHYKDLEAVVATLDYRGPALAAADGVQFIMNVDNFARGLALKQLKLYWTSPVFISDHRLLSPSNQMLLWQQMGGDDYSLLVPLAGDGMIGTLGVSEIDYRYEFRISSASADSGFAPRRIPLFAYALSADPYKLPRDAYRAAFATDEQYGRLRWEKPFPEIFRSLGWCSWNSYYQNVTAEKIVNSVRSLRDQQIPLGFVLVDDGWHTIKDNKLAGYDANPQKFPRGLSGLAKTLREQYDIPHVGVWHTFQGYWDGVDKDSAIGRQHSLFTGIAGKSLPDPRDGAGESFYGDWYARLKDWGYDFVKIDNQASNGKFTNNLLPLFASGGGQQKNLQEAAQKYFPAPDNDWKAPGNGAQPAAGGVNVINCMEMSLENAFNWRFSNIARNSDDYLPDSPQNAKEHVYQNAYNAYWTSNFAYPDWDMFQSHDSHAEFHAVARAISGGPIYITDNVGKERPNILRRLIDSKGHLWLLDEPGQVTRDLLLTDTALERVPLKVFGRISRLGVTAGMVAAFNVNKSAPRVAGTLSAKDVEGLTQTHGGGAAKIAVYQRSTASAFTLDASKQNTTFDLNGFGFDLFTLIPVKQGVAVFGLIDKYLGPAAILSQSLRRDGVNVRLREAGDFAAWLEQPPAKITIAGKTLAPSSYRYRQHLLVIPRSSFGGNKGAGEIVLEINAK